MPDFKKMLRDLADAYEREEDGENSQALTARIDALELKLAAAPKDERDEALEEITDEEYELIRQHRAGTTATADEEAAPPVVEEEPPAARKTRPGRKQGTAYHWTVGEDGKVQQVDIPTIYNGPDEEAEVELPADEPEADAA